MGKTLSIYLDLLRFLSAVAVFLHHLAPLTGRYQLFQRYGDDAVMVFFVLSGFVIAHVTAQKERTLAAYSASRLARLYSVAVPALALTLLLDYIGASAGGAYQDNSSHGIVRMAMSLTFTTQLWGLDIRPWSNVPYWSISYEFCYYVFFAIAMFAKRKALLMAAWAVIVGPCILLLLPVWLLGVFAYRYRPNISRSVGWSLTIAPLIAYALYNAGNGREILLAISDLEFIAPFGLHKARFWLHDYAVGLMVAAHFIGARVVCSEFDFGKLTKPIRAIAAYTFTLYLLHYPLQKAVVALHPLTTWADDLLVWIATAVCVYLVGIITEQRKSSIRNLIHRSYAYVSRIRPTTAEEERGAPNH